MVKILCHGVNIIIVAKAPLQSSSSEVLSSATRRPLIETGASSVFVWSSPMRRCWWIVAYVVTGNWFRSKVLERSCQ